MKKSNSSAQNTSENCKGNGGATARFKNVQQLTQQNVETILRLEESEKTKSTRADRLADAITSLFGSMYFVWAHVVFFAVWILLNTGLPRNSRFDPYPFSFLTLVVSLEAIFLSAFILISQNRQAKFNERRAHLDLQIDLLAEQENSKMLELLDKIACKIGATNSPDHEVKILAQAIKPESLTRQIDQTIERTGQASPSKQGGK